MFPYEQTRAGYHTTPVLSESIYPWAHSVERDGCPVTSRPFNMGEKPRVEERTLGCVLSHGTGQGIATLGAFVSVGCFC